MWPLKEKILISAQSFKCNLTPFLGQRKTAVLIIIIRDNKYSRICEYQINHELCCKLFVHASLQNIVFGKIMFIYTHLFLAHLS